MRQFFAGEVSAGQFAEDISGSVIRVDDSHWEIRICGMPGSFSLRRDHLIRLCDAFLDRELAPESLNAVAFALLASDAFEWDDEVTSEVLLDWSAPEVNFELNDATLDKHRGWLLGSAPPPVRKVVNPLHQLGGRLMSTRTKIPC